MTASLVLASIVGCKQKETLNSALVYSTLNDIIRQDSISADTVWAKFSDIDLPIGQKYEYLNSEISFMSSQIKKPVLHKIEPDKLFFYSRSKSTLVNSFIDSTSSKFSAISFSLPVFSRDFKTAILEINYTDQGRSSIYKKVDGQWKKIETYSSWIE
jgi:hypothetical protein